MLAFGMFFGAAALSAMGQYASYAAPAAGVMMTAWIMGLITGPIFGAIFGAILVAIGAFAAKNMK